MQAVNGIGARCNQNFVAPFKGWATKVIGREIHQLQVGACSPIKNKDPLTQGIEVWVIGCIKTGELRDSVCHKE